MTVPSGPVHVDLCQLPLSEVLRTHLHLVSVFVQMLHGLEARHVSVPTLKGRFGTG